jgi:ATP synthase F1 delta subunit
MSTNSQLSLAYSKALYFLGLESKKKTLFISRLIKPYKKNEENIYIIRQELFFFKAIFSSSATLSKILINPSINNLVKEKIIKDLFPGTSLLIKSFIRLLLENNHFSLFLDIIDDFEKFFKKLQNYSTIFLTIGSPIKKNSLIKLINILKKTIPVQNILLSFNYQPNLLGGIIIYSDFFIADLSIKKTFKNIIF